MMMRKKDFVDPCNSIIVMLIVSRENNTTNRLGLGGFANPYNERLRTSQRKKGCCLAIQNERVTKGSFGNPKQRNCSVIADVLVLKFDILDKGIE